MACLELSTEPGFYSEYSGLSHTPSMITAVLVPLCQTDPIDLQALDVSGKAPHTGTLTGSRVRLLALTPHT